jgi:hypothetical protein
MKPATLFFTLLFVTIIALSSAMHLKKKKLTTDAKTTTQSLVQPFHGVVSINSAVPSISLGNSVGNFGTGDFTLAFWFQTNGSSSLTDIIGSRQQGSLGTYISIRLTSAGYVTAELSQDTSGTGYVSLQSANSGLNDGNGHHFALVRASSQVTLYIDGVVSSQATKSPASITGLYPFQLGQSYSGFNPLTINFDDLRIYYSALTAAQLKVIIEDVAFL